MYPKRGGGVFHKNISYNRSDRKIEFKNDISSLYF